MSALRSRSGRNTLIVFGGEVLSAGLSFGLNLILLRHLDVRDYGVLSLFTSVTLILVGLMHFGWMDAFVRFGSIHLGEKSFAPVRLYLMKRIFLTSGIVAVIALAMTGPVSNGIYHRPEFVPFYIAAVFCALLNLALSFIQNNIRVQKLFWKYLYIHLAPNLVRFLSVGAAVLAGMLTLPLLVGLNTATPLLLVLIFVLSKNRSVKPLFGSQPIDPEARAQIGHYTKWIFVSYVTTHLIGNIDSHFLAYYHANETIGQFNAANRLIFPLQLMISALTTIFLPRLSAAKTDSEIKLYLSHLSLFLIPVGILVLIGCWVAPPLLIQLAGNQYQGIGLLLRLQILTMLTALLTNPVGLVLYAWGWSKGFALLNLAQLVVDLALNFLWIPRWGAEGASAATLTVHLMGMVFILTAVRHGLIKRRSFQSG